MIVIDRAFDLGAKNITERVGEIIIADNGAYLIEVDRFIKLANGKIVYTEIERYKGFVIKFNKNGIYNYSIFLGKTSIEDRITSLADAKRICDEFKLK